MRQLCAAQAVLDRLDQDLEILPNARLLLDGQALAKLGQYRLGRPPAALIETGPVVDDRFVEPVDAEAGRALRIELGESTSSTTCAFALLFSAQPGSSATAGTAHSTRKVAAAAARINCIIWFLQCRAPAPRLVY